MNDWVLQWLAAIVQQPGRLSGTALVLRGAQGSGKTLVGEVLGEVLGPRLYTKVSRAEELVGRFNGHLEGRLLVQVEEGFWAGDKKAEGHLKHFVTSPTVRVERKFMEPIEIPNFARVLITSNNSWVIPAGIGERRFAVLDVAGDRANDHEYFSALRAEMFKEGGCARLHFYLKNEVTVDYEKIARPPRTAALLEQQLQSLDATDRWLIDLLRVGALPGDSEGSGVTDRRALQDSFNEAMQHAGRSWDGTPERLGRVLKDRLGDLVSDPRPRVDGGRVYKYALAPLDECRAHVSRQLAFAPAWGEGQRAPSWCPLLAGWRRAVSTNNAQHGRVRDQ